MNPSEGGLDMSVADKAKNSADTAKGHVKEVTGRIKDDKHLEAEGKAEQLVGNLKQAGEKVKDAFKK